MLRGHRQLYIIHQNKDVETRYDLWIIKPVPKGKMKKSLVHWLNEE